MTPAELRTDVLLELHVIAAGDTPSGDDSVAVDDEYTRLHAELAGESMAWWNSDDNIPDEVARAVTLLLAHRLSRKFGKNEITRQRLEWDAVGIGNRHSAWSTLSEQSITTKPVSTPVTNY